MTAPTYMFTVTRTRQVTETVTVRAAGEQEAIRLADEAVDEGTAAVNEQSLAEPWEASIICPGCGGPTVKAHDDFADCATGTWCGWSEFEDSLAMARADGYA